MLNLALDYLPRAKSMLAGSIGPAQDVNRIEYGRQRVTKLVGKHREKIILPTIDFLQRRGALRNPAFQCLVGSRKRLLRPEQISVDGLDIFLRIRQVNDEFTVVEA